MRKDKLKINFQRIGALICACLIVFVGVLSFCSVSAFAAGASNTWIRAVFFVVSLPDDFENNIVNGEFALFDTDISSPIYSQLVFEDGEVILRSDSLPDLVIYSNGSLSSEFNGNLYVYANRKQLQLALNGGVAYIRFVKGTYYLDHDISFPGYTLDMGLVYFRTVQPIGNYGSFYEGFRVVESIDSADELFYISDLGQYVLVYNSVSGWLNENYREIRFTGSSWIEVPETALIFLVSNLGSAPPPPPSFLDRVTSGLTAVISWVGVVVSAVISGPLAPLLGLVAVGIAVSAILLVIYLVRRFIWGA